MDGIFVHHPQADFPVTVQEIFPNPWKTYPNLAFLSGAVRTELIAEVRVLSFEHFSTRYVFHSGPR